MACAGDEKGLGQLSGAASLRVQHFARGVAKDAEAGRGTSARGANRARIAKRGEGAVRVRLGRAGVRRQSSYSAKSGGYPGVARSRVGVAKGRDLSQTVALMGATGQP